MFIGTCLADASIFCNARASGSPSPMSLAPDRSASYSRLRLSDICRSAAASGARIAVATTEHRSPHGHAGHEGDDQRERRRDRADEDVAVADVADLVSEHTA